MQSIAAIIRRPAATLRAVASPHTTAAVLLQQARTFTSRGAEDRWNHHLQDDMPDAQHSKFVGVHWNDHAHKWQARVLNVNVLTSENEVDCARAHDRAVMALRRIGELRATATNATKGLLAEEKYSEQELESVAEWWRATNTLGRSADTVTEAVK